MNALQVETCMLYMYFKETSLISHASLESSNKESINQSIMRKIDPVSMSVTWPSFNKHFHAASLFCAAGLLLWDLLDMLTPVSYHNCFSSLKSLWHEKKTIFTAIIRNRTFYGLQHQYHTENAQNRTITRVASWGPDHRKWLFSKVRGLFH